MNTLRYPLIKNHLKFFFFLALIVFASGCSKEEPRKNTSKEDPVTQTNSGGTLPEYTNITKQAGINFVHNNGAFGTKYLPESMSSGCAFLDYNNDGYQDIFLVNFKDWPDHKSKTSYPALYKNNGNGTFTDVTASAGLASEIYGLGVSAGDYDNDGNIDIFVSCLDQDRLYHNNGNGTFTDVAEKSGIKENEFGTSSTWFDYDKDGLLDLYVCNYVKWTKETDLFCTLDGVNKSYCTPESYPGTSPHLYHNEGNGKFSDVTHKAGLFDPTSKALGVVAFDYDMDGWLDLFVANDTQPNKLYRNNKDGTFSDKAVMSGVAFSETGVARAGMGVDAADFTNSGYAGIIVGNFSNEMIGLYHNEGTGLFIDEAPATAVGQDSILTLTFGTFFFDFDLDGKTDIFAANGHVHDDISKVQQTVTYAQSPHLFHNLGNHRFALVTKRVGSSLQTPIVARGAAYGDVDNDGDPDVLISTNAGSAVLFRNEGTSNHYLKLKLVGTKSNRDAIGARVVVHLSDKNKQWQQVKSGMSYCSQSELPLTFGLGKITTVPKVEIFWPSGRTQILENVASGKILTVQED
ncbi:CRTAC1 family protein [bacterium]|nr:CRTAC1 family protein [bacterium]MCI0614628.1 CRTAC1 family protein [bacterium]